MYKNTTIYSMSGTGNSYRVSTWMGEISRKHGSCTKNLPIDKSKPREEIGHGNNHLIGVVFPTHGFTMPWHVFKFVWGLPRRKSTHAFCFATRASFKFGNHFVDGISGTGTFIVALMLALKGYKVRGSSSYSLYRKITLK